MDLEKFLSDDIICEEFQDYEPINCNKNIIIEKMTTELNQIDKVNTDSKSTSYYGSNCEKSYITDTTSLNSDENESCSGSSLPVYESQNENESNNVHSTKPDVSSQDLKAAIKVQWMDKSVYIQKSFQHSNQDIWKDYIKQLNLENSLAVDEYNVEKPYFNENNKCYDVNLLETLDSASLIKDKIPNEDIENSVENFETVSLLPTAIENENNNSLIFHQPNVLLSSVISVAKRFDISNDFVNQIDNKDHNNLPEINSEVNAYLEHYRNTLDVLKAKNKSLLVQIDNKDKQLDTFQNKFNGIIRYNNELQQQLQESDEKNNSLRYDINKMNCFISKLENENSVIKAANENLKHFKMNAENMIISERKNREFLEQKIENFSSIEYDYQWLCKAFVDYKALGQDYDLLQMKCGELENKLLESNYHLEDLKVQASNLKMENEQFKRKFDQVQTNQNHFHENICSCTAHKFENPHSYSKSKSHHKHLKRDRNKHKERTFSANNVDYNSNDEDDEQYEVEKIQRFEAKPDAKELESQYDVLQMKKRSLESELCHVPLTNSTNRLGNRNTSRGEKEKIEDELDKVDLELSSIRRTLKQLKPVKNGIGF